MVNDLYTTLPAMIDLSKYSKNKTQPLPMEVREFIEGLDGLGFDVLSIEENMTKATEQDLTHAARIYWEGHFVGRLGQWWHESEPTMLGYQFIDHQGHIRAAGPRLPAVSRLERARIRDQFEKEFARKHECDEASVKVTSDGFIYVSIKDPTTATKILCESATALFALRLAVTAPEGIGAEGTDDESILERHQGDPTTAKRVIDARQKQGQFRKDLLGSFGRCVVTGISIEPVLIASHIVAFKDPSTNDEERIDKQNGLLLSANVDALFDRHLMTFLPNGKPEFSFVVNGDICELGFSAEELNLKIPLKGRRAAYMERHRVRFHAKEEARRRSLDNLSGSLDQVVPSPA